MKSCPAKSIRRTQRRCASAWLASHMSAMGFWVNFNRTICYHGDEGPTPGPIHLVVGDRVEITGGPGEALAQPNGDHRTDAAEFLERGQQVQGLAENGTDISNGVASKPIFVAGRAVGERGGPIAGTQVDGWHGDGEGF